ncbi:CoA-transferase [soil metagenome]
MRPMRESQSSVGPPARGEAPSGSDVTGPTRADVCAAAVADCFACDGEILANPIGTMPVIGGRLARATTTPDLVMNDGYAMLAGAVHPLGTEGDAPVVEGWNPYRTMFDVVWGGRRHVMMGATQVDRWGNQNIAAIGDPTRPTVQLLGFRGAPGNTINNTTSYWVPNHSPKVFVEAVDVVCGIGYDRAAQLGPVAARFHEIRRVVSNLGVFDFETPDQRMRLRSVHPGVDVDAVVAATGFELAMPDEVPTSREPTDEELRLIREEIDPDGARHGEVPEPARG